jgi:hypothetical protein
LLTPLILIRIVLPPLILIRIVLTPLILIRIVLTPLICTYLHTSYTCRVLTCEHT